MSKFERIFYFFIILVEFAVIILLNIRLNDCVKNRAVELQSLSRHNLKLYSFHGIKPDGEKEFVHFKAYSGYYYIIMTYSSQCHHCRNMLEDVTESMEGLEIQPDIKIMLITSDEFPQYSFCDLSEIHCLKITYEDWVQFGLDTPAIFAINGKGEILYNQKGYIPGLFNKMFKRIEERKNETGKSKSIN